MKQLISMLRARHRRFWYLLCKGMWKGECAVTIKTAGKTKVIGSGAPTKVPGVFKNYRIFYP